MWQLRCPLRGYIVAGIDARLTDRAIDVSIRGENGAPVGPGVTTGAEVLFTAVYTGGARSGRPSGPSSAASRPPAAARAARPRSAGRPRSSRRSRSTAAWSSGGSSPAAPCASSAGVPRGRGCSAPTPRSASASSDEPGASLLNAVRVRRVVGRAAVTAVATVARLRAAAAPGAAPGACALHAGDAMSFEAPGLLARAAARPARRGRVLAPAAAARAATPCATRTSRCSRRSPASGAPGGATCPAALCSWPRSRPCASRSRGPPSTCRRRTSARASCSSSTSPARCGPTTSSRRGSPRPSRRCARSSTGRPTRSGRRRRVLGRGRRSSSRRRSTASCSRRGSTCSGRASAPRSATPSRRAVELARTATGETGEDGQAPARAVKDAEGRSLASILLLSDGAQTRGLLSPGQGAERAQIAGIPVFTIALGTDAGTILAGPPGPGAGHPRAARPRDARRDRGVHGRRVVRRRERRRAREGLRGPRLARRPHEEGRAR